MTAKKGSQWKTSWNRGRGTPIPDPLGDMAYFQDFKTTLVDVATYETTVPSTLGTSLPFWFALVAIRVASGGQAQASAFPAFTEFAYSQPGLVFALAQVGLTSVVNGLAVTGDDFVAAILAVARPSGLTYYVRSRVDDQVGSTGTSAVPFVPATGPLIIDPQALPGALHGFAGGPFDPTDAEIKQWFTSLKATLKIQAIPGKTTHLYSAASVPLGPAPALLPNFGSAGAAQDMSLITAGAPTPVNVLIPTRFPW